VQISNLGQKVMEKRSSGGNKYKIYDASLLLFWTVIHYVIVKIKTFLKDITHNGALV
jgi:hypothetical protein